MYDPIYEFLLLGSQVFTTFFLLGIGSIIIDEMFDDDDDDDDQDGGILQPCYVTNR